MRLRAVPTDRVDYIVHVSPEVIGRGHEGGAEDSVDEARRTQRGNRGNGNGDDVDRNGDWDRDPEPGPRRTRTSEGCGMLANMYAPAKKTRLCVFSHRRVRSQCEKTDMATPRGCSVMPTVDRGSQSPAPRQAGRGSLFRGPVRSGIQRLCSRTGRGNSLRAGFPRLSPFFQIRAAVRIRLAHRPAWGSLKEECC